ncbi:MAG: glycosyltransferase family 1 protein [Sphingobium sp.]|nr:glycosyltransferase family 1 protein [Sphingobium sp.]
MCNFHTIRNIYDLLRKKKHESPRQLLVDVSVFWRRDAGTGIQRVVRALSRQLLDAQNEEYQIRFVAATRRRRYRYLDLCDRENLRFRPGGRVKIGAGDIFLGLDLSSRILPKHKHQVMAWRKRGVRICVVIYDLLPVEHPEWFGNNHSTQFENWLRFIGHYVDMALCISQSVEESLKKWLKQEQISRADAIDIRNFPLGGDLSKSQPSIGITEDNELALELLKSHRYVLTVGTIEPRKGHAIALDAFDLLFAGEADDVPALVIVGRSGWKTDDLQERIRGHKQLGKKLFWFDNASDELLDKLYDGCAGVLFPSLAEGFGLPVVEALMHHRPVLVRNLTVFRELGMPSISYFDEDSPTALAKAITDWLKRGRKTYGTGPHEIFTWKKSCDVLLRHLRVLIR